MAEATDSFHLSADEILATVRFGPLVEALAQMHRETPASLKDMLLEQDGSAGKDYCLVRAAWQQGEALGVKMATIFPGNPAPELPAIHAAYVLFDGATGVPLLSIDGTALTYLKTAADSALGSRLLARDGCRRLLLVGAGAMAPYLIEAHCAAHPTIDEVRVWNRSPARRDALVDALQTRYNIAPVDELENAVGNADLVSCATMAVQPIIRGEWLRKGTHLDLVGAFRADMREADDEALRRARLFVDSRKTTISEIGELLIPITNGVISADDIVADLYQLCSGVAGRTGPKEITLFKNGGGGHLDLMTARFIRECCRPG